MRDYQATPDFYSDYISHHGRLGQRWGVRNGPPYPLDREAVSKAYGKGSSGLIDRYKKKKAFIKQKRHPKQIKTDKEILKDIDKIVDKYDPYYTTHKNPKKIQPINGIKIKTKEYTAGEDMKAVNPNWEKNIGYQNNCVFCSMTYDMRCRGYDVTANPRGPEQLIGDGDFRTISRSYYPPPKIKEATCSNDNNRWIRNKKGYYIKLKSKPTMEERQTLITDMAKEFSKYPNNSRGMVSLHFWFDVGGHAVAWEKRNNQIYMMDTQSDNMDTLESNYLIRQGYVGGASIYRLDNLDIIPGNVKEFCR